MGGRDGRVQLPFEKWASGKGQLMSAQLLLCEKRVRRKDIERHTAVAPLCGGGRWQVDALAKESTCFAFSSMDTAAAHSLLSNRRRRMHPISTDAGHVESWKWNTDEEL